MSAPKEDITCRELVELVNDYLDGSLAAADRALFDAHLKACEGCRAYVEQIRQTIEASGRLTEESLDSQARTALLQTFRDWKRERDA